MIKLNLGIGKGDCKEIEFNNAFELIDYLKELDRFDCIWLATEDGEGGEILVTENLWVLINAVESGHFNLTKNDPKYFFVQEYQTYEDAYSVALSMREPNPRCYNG